MKGSLDPSPILVVDDDATGRLICRAALENVGMQVIEADSAEAALHELEVRRFGAVVLDLVLPARSGYDVLTGIRAVHGDRNLPVLVLTALDDESAITRAYELGASDFATKPIHPVVLGHRMRFLLRNRHTQARLEESETRLELAQSIARLGHFESDDRLEELTMHRAASPLLRNSDSDTRITLTSFFQKIPAEERGRVIEAWSHSRERRVPLHVAHRTHGLDGQLRFVECHGAFLGESQGERRRFIGTIQDVTERQAARDRLAFLSEHDALTGALTRHAFVERTDSVLMVRTAGREVAVLVLDIDHFAGVNEAFGMAAGDELLRTCARRLETIWRAEWRAPRSVVDRSGVTRIGADQFALLFLTDVRADDEGSRISRTIQDAVAAPVLWGASNIIVTASVGIAMYPGDGRDAETLLASACAAAKDAKARGPSRVRHYTAALRERVARRRRLEAELREALVTRTLEVFYQPKRDLEAGTCRSVEALARLRLKDGTICPPGEFLPLAEELGLLEQVDTVAFAIACRQSTRWAAREFGPIRIAVNLSHESFWDPSLLQRLRATLTEHGASARFIDIELTETIVMSEPAGAKRVIDQLRQLGFRLGLDDFGTGHSSLAQLRRLPIDTLKIDRAFVAGLPHDAADVAIARAIVAMAQSLGFEIVAEGVETPEQVDFVHKLGCHLVQGYAVARPLPADEVERMFAS